MEQRQYLEGISTELQDLIYEDRGQEATKLLMSQKGLGKMQAVAETMRISIMLKKEFPDALSADSSQSPSRLTEKQQHTILWVIASLFVLVGVVFIGVGTHGITLGLESRNWPSTEARILHSEIEETQERVRSESGRMKTTTFHHARITYEFSVDGVTYQGDRITSADHDRGAAHARRVVDRYPKGKQVTAYYKPGQPGRSLLEPGIQGRTFVLPAIGLIPLLLGGALMCAIVVFGRKKRRNPLQATAPDIPIREENA